LVSNSPLLPLQDMADRHPALTHFVAGSYIEAARTCLDRYHSSPIEFTIKDNGKESFTQVEWEVTDSRIQLAWANEDDATRDGAYALAIAAIELLRGMVAVSRTKRGTGADYYISFTDGYPEDLENCCRLEVSGTGSSKESEVNSRLRIKIEQAREGKSNLPAIAAIIGFQVQLILVQTVE
jgi:hypothetical protein